MAVDNLRPGNMLGKYRIDERFSEGSICKTYRAYDTEFTREVVIKEFSISGNPADSSSLDEAKMLVKCSSPNIPAVHERLEKENRAFIVMEFCENGDLKQRLFSTSAYRNEDNVRKVLDAICDALEVVHGKGIVHCDIKPANIVFKVKDIPVLIDFGASRRSGNSNEQDVIFLTPDYASLEQLTNTVVDYRSDIYSLAAVAYHCLKGKAPDIATSRKKTDTAELVANKRDSSAFLKSIDWALSVEAADRPQSVTAWRANWGEVPKDHFDSRDTSKNADERINGHHSESLRSKGMKIAREPIISNVSGVLGLCISALSLVYALDDNGGENQEMIMDEITRLSNDVKPAEAQPLLNKLTDKSMINNAKDTIARSWLKLSRIEFNGDHWENAHESASSGSIIVVNSEIKDELNDQLRVIKDKIMVNSKTQQFEDRFQQALKKEEFKNM